MKQGFHCFLQLGDITSGFRESKAVSVSQISKKSKLKMHADKDDVWETIK